MAAPDFYRAPVLKVGIDETNWYWKTTMGHPNQGVDPGPSSKLKKLAPDIAKPLHANGDLATNKREKGTKQFPLNIYGFYLKILSIWEIWAETLIGTSF